MALRSPESTPGRDLGPRGSPPAASLLPNSRGGSSSKAKADVGRKATAEVDLLLAKLEKEGVQLDDKIATIIDDGIARIKAEAAMENISEVNRKGKLVLLTIVSVAVGFVMGVDWFENALRKKLAKSRRE
ncbi:hypothetical protein HU200_043325 [Digitaria exilis]|uniref:Uncharacterized protein n=1 Tax=Digitaria exilis TaxID=1010633 RepID=A0A835B613_9POAL|nr:hypothetical protein HU200_043325 [Digitaria exilis]CAB3469018.1 unnamed protein product [Digitaria exilis]